MSHSAAEVEEEQIHFANVIATFKNYAQYSLAANNRRRKDLFILPREDRDILDTLGYKDKLDAVDKAILVNAEFLNQIVADPEIFGHDLGASPNDDSGVSFDSFPDENDSNGRILPGQTHSHSHDHDRGHGHTHSHDQQRSSGWSAAPTSRRPKRYKPTDFDMDKLRSTLKQFVRDWSSEGKDERDKAYEPMKEALLAHFSDIPPPERRNFRVLVPGAGLGRLAWDIAKLGFACQGNEFSHYMLLSSYLMLNKTEQIEKFTIHPYVHSFSNVPNRDAMLREVRIPDVLPTGLPPGSDFSLVAGDFEEIYGSDGEDSEEPQAGQWDAVLTCFFIDTAKNIVNYLRIIHTILAPGGVWINLGPLLWHFENNNTNDPSVELDLDEVKQLCRKIGFEISNERRIPTTYTNNSKAMLGYIYDTAFWTATKIT
ncbi:hypothetical protein HGRIS_012171 [Hohenbuehelia grisea]|uniref:carnosine N-methyltransferase n=1 Tax=Hohenbuehelia grisea TaxID=104357 RepID=A0ABR3IRF2_9AGAR